MKKLFILLFISGLVFATYSCKKDTGEDPNPPSGIVALQIPDGFLFESTREIELTIILPTAVTWEESGQRVDIYTGLPNEGGKLVYSAAFPVSGKLELKLRIPSTAEQLYVNSFAGSQLLSLSVLNQKEGGFEIDFNNDMGFNEPVPAPEEKSAAIGHGLAISNAFVPHYKSIGVNLIANGDFSQDDFGLFADWPSPMLADGKWYITSTLGTSHAKQHQQAGEFFLRITRSPARYGGVAQLIPASAGDLITLSSDIKITGNNSNISWLFLIPRNAAGQSIGYYSLQTAGNNNAWTGRTLAATMPFGTTHLQVLLWNHIYGGAIDYDNVFVTGPVSDSDGDGVDDDLDDYPNDPDRAFDVYYPNVDDYGTLAFEDLWPGKGDYDFNDLVLDYRFKQVLNANNSLVEFFMDYSVRAIGAELVNGFGIAIPGTTPNDIASISGQQLTESYISLAANGTESGQSEAVIILFDNAFSMIGTPSGGFGVNTSPEAPYVEPQWNQLVVTFQPPVSVSQTGFAPYNPFLIIDKDRGREVHLPGMQPTDLHDPEWLGQWFDDSNPATGKYYQSATNLPWAIDLPVQFEYPVEKVEITDAHFKFGSWAESGGISFEDWYKDLAGYRNNNLIYTPPVR